MSDITMCSTNDCPVRTSCYRHVAPPSEYWQAYVNFYKEGEKKCKHFWNVADYFRLQTSGIEGL